MERYSDKEFIRRSSAAIAKRLREIADEIEASNSIASLGADFDMSNFSCEYRTIRGMVSVDIKTVS